MNVSDALSSWIAYRHQMVQVGLVADSTFTNQRAIVGVLDRALGRHALAALRKSHIELWLGSRLQTCSPVTVRGEMNVLRQVMRWAIDEGHLTIAPRFPKLAVPNVESALPSDTAFLWVLANVPLHHAAALEFMMLTGLSPHELERVQVRDAGLTSAGGAPIQPMLGIGKRDDFAVKQESRRRWVPLNGRAGHLWFENAAGLQVTACPFPTVAAMQKAIRRACTNEILRSPRTLNGPIRRAPPGSADITPKMMRKWFASKVAGEQPEHVLQRLMGHAPGSPITRRHYVRSNDDQLAGAVAAVAP